MFKSLAKKRILIFLRSFEIGGAERQAAMLANYLYHTENAKVAVWAYGPPGPLLELLDKNIVRKSIPLNLENLKLENIPKRKIDLWNLALAILRFRPHAILPYTLTPNTDCGYIWKMTGAKTCIWNQRDEWLDFLDHPENEIEIKSFENIPIFVSNSKRGAELIQKKLKSRPAGKVRFIPNAVQLEEPKKNRSEWRKKLAVGNKDIVAVMIANLTKNKDHVTLLKAWKTVIGNSENKPLLVLAGRNDETRDELKSLAKELNIESYVCFLGFTRDISGLLKASDLAFLCSKSEGSPNGILEPMAAGLPVISYKIRGAEDILGRNYPFYAPMGNEKGLAETILKIIRDKKMRTKIGIENYDKVAENFSPEAALDKYSRLIEQMLSGSGINYILVTKELWKFWKIIKKIKKELKKQEEISKNKKPV